MKIVKSRLFKNYLERKKSQAQFCLSLGWLHISEKKLLETATLVGAGARNIGKEVSFCPTLTLILPILYLERVKILNFMY